MSKGSKFAHLAKKTPTKTENLQKQMDIFYEKFNVVTYLLHITSFQLFLGHPRG